MPDLLTRGAAAIAEHPRARGDIELVVQRVRRRQRRRRVAVSTLALVLLTSGVTAGVRQLRGQSIVTSTGTIDAGGLRMSGTAGDCYDLDPSVVPAGWERRVDPDVLKLAVCTSVEDTADGPVCTETEGPAGVGQVGYVPPDATAGPHGVPELGVVTTHTHLALDDYVKQWTTMGKGAESLTPATIRGHRAWAYDTNGPNTPTLTWEERPGIIVSVSGSEIDPAIVARAAEAVTVVDVERLPLPVVVARAQGLTWEANDNNHPYLLATRHDGEECVGFDFIDGCSQTLEDRVHIVFAGGGYVVLGATVTGADTVDAVGADGTILGSVAPNAVPGFRSTFFAIPSGATPPARVVVHVVVSGSPEKATVSIDLAPPPVGPTTLPSTVDGVDVVGLGQMSTPSGFHFRFSAIKPRVATRSDGTPVDLGQCFVLETTQPNVAWCGKLTEPVVLGADGAVVVITPAGWVTDPVAGEGSGDPKAPDWSITIGDVDHPVTFTGPGSSTPTAATPVPAITFADLTARLTDG